MVFPLVMKHESSYSLRKLWSRGNKTKDIQVEDLPRTGGKLTETGHEHSSKPTASRQTRCPPPVNSARCPGESPAPWRARQGLQAAGVRSALVIEWLCSVTRFFWLLFWELKIKSKLYIYINIYILYCKTYIVY